MRQRAAVLSDPQGPAVSEQGTDAVVTQAIGRGVGGRDAAIDGDAREPGAPGPDPRAALTIADEVVHGRVRQAVASAVQPERLLHDDTKSGTLGAGHHGAVASDQQLRDAAAAGAGIDPGAAVCDLAAALVEGLEPVDALRVGGPHGAVGCLGQRVERSGRRCDPDDLHAVVRWRVATQRVGRSDPDTALAIREDGV